MEVQAQWRLPTVLSFKNTVYTVSEEKPTLAFSQQTAEEKPTLAFSQQTARLRKRQH